MEGLISEGSYNRNRKRTTNKLYQCWLKYCLHLLALIKLQDVIINQIHSGRWAWEGGGERLISGGAYTRHFCSGYFFTYYLVPLSIALDSAPVCLFKWKLRSKLWRWRKVLRATLRIDAWATLANTAFLNSLKREALVRAAPSANHKWVTISVNFLFRNSKSSIHLTTVNSLLMDTSIRWTPYWKGHL